MFVCFLIWLPVNERTKYLNQVWHQWTEVLLHFMQTDLVITQADAKKTYNREEYSLPKSKLFSITILKMAPNLQIQELIAGMFSAHFHEGCYENLPLICLSRRKAKNDNIHWEEEKACKKEFQIISNRLQEKKISYWIIIYFFI